jgi:hypothetical protein
MSVKLPRSQTTVRRRRQNIFQFSAEKLWNGFDQFPLSRAVPSCRAHELNYRVTFIGRRRRLKWVLFFVYMCEQRLVAPSCAVLTWKTYVSTASLWGRGGTWFCPNVACNGTWQVTHVAIKSYICDSCVSVSYSLWHYPSVKLDYG